MSEPLTPEQIRESLRRLIEVRHRTTLTRKVVGQVARTAGVEASTLALYFGFYPKKRQTERLQESTLRSVLLAVGVDPYEFFRSVGDWQLEFWPSAANVESISPSADSGDHLRIFAVSLQALPFPIRVRASRAAISAAIGSIAEAGSSVPEEAYELLRRLDGVQSEIRQLRLLA
jgi:hypothetical protein